MKSLAIETIGTVAGILTTVSFFPQVIKVIKTKSTHDLSIWMFSLFSTGVFLWIIYGACYHSIPIVIANTITLFCAMIILGYKIKYG